MIGNGHGRVPSATMTGTVHDGSSQRYENEKEKEKEITLRLSLGTVKEASRRGSKVR